MKKRPKIGHIKKPMECGVHSRQKCQLYDFNNWDKQKYVSNILPPVTVNFREMALPQIIAIFFNWTFSASFFFISVTDDSIFVI